jgi:hypothetical protein
MEMFFGRINYFCKINHNCLYSSFKPQYKKLKIRSQTNSKKETQKPAANPSTHTQHNKPAPKIPASTQQPLQHQRHQHILTPTLNKRKLHPKQTNQPPTKTHLTQ